MNFLRHLFGRKESTSPTKESSEQSYFFICCGNAGVINSYYDVFKVGVRPYKGAAGRYSASVGNLDIRRQEANKASLSFVGQSYMGSNRRPPKSHMHEVLGAIAVEGLRKVYIAFVSVNQSGTSWVQKVYAEFLQQAMSQGILPYTMYITKDKDAAEFLLGSFEIFP